MNKNFKIITLLIVAMPASSALAWSFSDTLANLKTVASNAYNSEYANNAKTFLADRYERAAISAGVIRDAVVYNEDVVAIAARIPSKEQISEGAKNAYNATVAQLQNPAQLKDSVVASMHHVSDVAKQGSAKTFNYIKESELAAKAGTVLTATQEIIAQHPTAAKTAAGVTAAVAVTGIALKIKSELNKWNAYNTSMKKDKTIILNALQVQINTDMKRLGLGEQAVSWNEMRNSFNKDTVDFTFLNNNPCQVGKLAKELSDVYKARRVKAAALAFEQAYNDYVLLGLSEKVLRNNLEKAKAHLEDSIALYRVAKEE